MCLWHNILLIQNFEITPTTITCLSGYCCSLHHIAPLPQNPQHLHHTNKCCFPYPYNIEGNRVCIIGEW